MKQSPALKSWLAHPTKKLRETFARALDRAEKSAKGFAGVAVGRRRLEVKKDAGAWTVIDPKTGEEAHHTTRTKRVRKARVINDETPAQFKRRMSREIDRDSRKKAAAAIQQKAAKKKAEAKAAREERTRELAKSRGTCREDLDKARRTPTQPGRRIAVAKTRVGCAARAAAIEETFGGKLDEIHTMLKQIHGERPARRRRATSAKRPTAKKERREERDDAVRSELERRGLHHLLPVWEQKKGLSSLRSLPFDRAIERFVELVDEDPEAVELAQAAAGDIHPGDIACEQASHFAAQGDPDAAAFAAENCDGGRVRRGSAASRTLSMFAGIAPPAEQPKPRGRREARAEPRGPLRGQQTLGAGRFGRSVLDPSNSQIPF